MDALAFSTACETTSMALTAQQQQTQIIRSLRQPIVSCLVPIKQELRVSVEVTGARGQQTLGAQAALRLHRARDDAVLDTCCPKTSLVMSIRDVQENAFGGVRNVYAHAQG